MKKVFMKYGYLQPDSRLLSFVKEDNGREYTIDAFGDKTKPNSRKWLITEKWIKDDKTVEAVVYRGYIRNEREWLIVQRLCQL